LVRILHCADLHLSLGEQAYSLAVLDELAGLAAGEKVDIWLLAGDLFDGADDAQGLRAAFRERVQPLAERTAIVMIPGNHERLGTGAPCLDRLDFGVPWRLRQPFELVEPAGIEILTIPWGAETSDYLSWQVPQKKAKLRIALAHGTVAGFNLSGPEDETDGSAMDPALFARFEIDYAALGHIHAGRVMRSGGITIAYPGSARVWRRGEAGPRRAILLDADPEAGTLGSPRGVEIAAAGRFRVHEHPLGLDGSSADLAREADSWGAHDWVEVRLSGLVEDEGMVAALERDLRAAHAPRLRRFEVSRDDILVLEGIASQPIARRFLSLWAERRPADPAAADLWLAARDAGLRRIKALLEARR
jgi:predicted phosphodiesterase